ncbi:hypothetical protein QLL95_gp0753 [Cotonvirus japonicus]|uniref:Uncharacterized protein n=1 Tax=Cotonvirus japonicus TaxID=2811091 RepID=A0ABM7NT69_9VIRU|nr:hypothetical protein QLL95_gp0753 [Cotonvirus japonicus]BCS83370.1 hypothetical protein [Cotonvirus japonicus]
MDRISQSEIHAKIATTNNHPSEFTFKTDRDMIKTYDLDLRQELEIKESLKFDDFSEYTEINLISQCSDKNYTMGISFTNCEIYKITLKIHTKIIDEDVLEKIRDLNFTIEIGGCIIFRSTLDKIILFAKYLEMEVTQYGDYIYVPVPLTYFFFMKKIPLQKFKYHMFKILLEKHNFIENVESVCHIRKNDNYNDSYNIVIKNILDIREIYIKTYKTYIPFKINLIAKMILIELKHDDVIDPTINRIELHINCQNDPIVYEMDFDEIIVYNILGKKYYGISLCRELLYKKDIKRLFTDDIKCVSGINFSRIETAGISILGSDNLYKCQFILHFFLINKLIIQNDMLSLKYGC